MQKIEKETKIGIAKTFKLFKNSKLPPSSTFT
jgi:hypothetical protein